jgi:coenzyme F420-dependent glucose-6-phosphate dehydrogenase
MPAVAEGAEAAERDVAGIDKMIEIKMSYDRDREKALENTPFLGAAVADAEAGAERVVGRGDGAAG